MIYGDEKRLQMARSILPSRRSFKKDKQHVKQAARSAIAGRLRGYGEDEPLPLRAEPRAEIRGLVLWRRALDKLNHFERWAQRVTADLPQERRLSAMRAVLPEGLIGEHALGHLRHLDHFRSPEEREIRDAERRRWRASVAPVTDEERLPLLRAVFRDQEAWALLSAEVAAAHRTRLWPVGRGRVEVALRAGAWEPADPARWRAVGRLRPPAPSDAADLPDYLELVRAAAAAPREVPAGEHEVVVRLRLRRGKWVLRRSATLPNPASHPEWAAALDGFLLRWRRLDGDLARVRRGY